MPEVVSVGGLLIPTLRVSLLLTLMLAGWLASRYAARLELDGTWSGNVAEQSIWLGLLGARLGFVVANWSAYSGEPWTALYVWQGGFMPVVGLITGSGYALWRLRQRDPRDRGRYVRVLLGGFGAAALLFGLVLASTRVELDSSRLGVGDPMPDFTLTDLRGELVSFSSLEGRAVVLNFWATWCPPCRREMPLLDDVQEEYGPKGLTIVGIDLEESPETVRRYVESVGVSYSIWLDDPTRAGADRTRDLYTSIGGVGLPTTLFIDKDGVIQSSQVGELSRGVLQSRIATLLASPD